MFGFLNVNKPIGMTSHDVISVLRKITKIKQIGHSGTLDPFAEGVLPVAIGKATRLIEFLDDDKEYLAQVSFGKNTSTYDIEGDVVFESGTRVCRDEVLEALKNFEGEILQMPPLYSAIKVRGKKLYEYVREGKSVEVSPRKIFIKSIELKSFDEENQLAEILISCSKGTYIRSIAYDLGKILFSGAFLSKLVRVRAGNFKIEDSVTLDELKNGVEGHIFIPKFSLAQYEISDDEHEKILHGQFLKVENNFSDGDTIILTYNNEISATAKIDKDLIKVKKVFR
ncbi:MAG: tRNA pseudouridine(55) synthase TruB [Candidatus Melainabacteria bacterium]|nr:MAG: tRNA pseudouridine(55) synthase TruB [Candidatus Melainabacteria bacterium]